MNITKIAAISGAGVLAIAAVFAGKPRLQPSTIFYTVGGSCTGRSFNVTASTHFTTSGTGNQATIKTQGALQTRKTLWAACTSGVPSKPVHFHP